MKSSNISSVSKENKMTEPYIVHLAIEPAYERSNVLQHFVRMTFTHKVNWRYMLWEWAGPGQGKRTIFDVLVKIKWTKPEERAARLPALIDFEMLSQENRDFTFIKSERRWGECLDGSWKEEPVR